MKQKLKIYNLNSLLDFGRYKNYQVFEIYQFQPSYIDWLISNADIFCINTREFENIEDPTPFKLFKIEVNNHFFWVNNVSPDFDYIKWAYLYLLEGNIIEKKKHAFSEEAIRINNVKYSKINN